MSAVPLKVWNGSEWINVGVQSGAVLYQNEAPASPQTGMIWIDADSETSVVSTDNFVSPGQLSEVEALALLGL